jgi:hypothetical protein
MQADGNAISTTLATPSAPPGQCHVCGLYLLPLRTYFCNATGLLFDPSRCVLCQRRVHRSCCSTWGNICDPCFEGTPTSELLPSTQAAAAVNANYFCPHRERCLDCGYPPSDSTTFCPAHGDLCPEHCSICGQPIQLHNSFVPGAHRHTTHTADNPMLSWYATPHQCTRCSHGIWRLQGSPNPRRRRARRRRTPARLSFNLHSPHPTTNTTTTTTQHAPTSCSPLHH